MPCPAPGYTDAKVVNPRRKGITMSTLREYLQQKREAILARRAKAADEPPSPHTVSARVKAEGRSGVRRSAFVTSR